MSVHAVGSGTHWDDRRNTSRTIAVPPGAHKAVLAHLSESRTQEWYRWPLIRHEAPPVYCCRKCKRWVMDGYGCRCGAKR